MPMFQYSAVDAAGRVERGTLPGASMDAVARQLADKGWTVHELSVAKVVGDPLGDAAVLQLEPPAPPAPPQPVEAPRLEEGWTPPPVERRNPFVTQILGPLVGKVPLTAIHFFFRQLGTMLNAGVNPAQALETLARQTRSRKLSRVILEARDHVIAGRPMSAGFQRYPEVFTPLMMSMLRAGEEGGFLPQQLKQLSEYVQKEIELRNLIRRETLYPKLIVFASIIIIGGANMLIAYLAPSGARLNSPLTTPAVWVVLAPILVALFLFFRVGLAQPRIKYFWDAFVIHVPWFGSTARGFAMAKFGRSFGALYKGGVPIHKGLRLAADACGNEYVRAHIHPAADNLEGGAGLTETLESTGTFSPIVLDMTRTGEMTGNVDEMLEKMSEFYEDEGQTRAKQAATALGVVALLLVAAYVGYVVVSFYVGYFGGIGQELDNAGRAE